MTDIKYLTEPKPKEGLENLNITGNPLTSEDLYAFTNGNIEKCRISPAKI